MQIAQAIFEPILAAEIPTGLGPYRNLREHGSNARQIVAVDSRPGDVLLIEQVDRLSRLTAADWQKLRADLDAKQISVVALDLPTSWMLAHHSRPTSASRISLVERFFANLTENQIRRGAHRSTAELEAAIPLSPIAAAARCTTVSRQSEISKVVECLRRRA